MVLSKKAKPKYSLLTLPRNDPDAALELASNMMRAGQWSPEAAHMILATQDDPRDLTERLDELFQQMNPKMLEPKRPPEPGRSR
jgi:hypothetical protein